MSDFELIEEYLAGRLSAEDNKKFRTRLLNDSAFNHEFQELKEIRLHVRQNARVEIKNLFDEFETSIEKEETTKDQTVMKKVISIAASIILIAAISYIGLTDFNPPSNQELFDEHFTSYVGLTGQVRGAAEEMTLEKQALNAYDGGDYISSEEMLSELVAAQPNAMNYFYLGMSQLELGKTEDAVKNLNTVINNYNSFTEQAKWYLALAHLKNNDEDAALGSLANIITRNSEFEEKAFALLTEMGFNLDETELESGPIIVVDQRPKEENAPDGSFTDDTKGARFWQWGIVSSAGGDKSYRFSTDQPLKGLQEGDMTVFVVIERGRRNGGRNNSGIDGRAFIVDKY